MFQAARLALIAVSEMSFSGVECIAQSAAPAPVSSLPSYCVSPGANVCDAASFFCSAGESSRATDPSCTARAPPAESGDEPVTTAALTAAASKASAKAATASGRTHARRRGLWCFDDMYLHRLDFLAPRRRQNDPPRERLGE